jgi:2-keto-4-pentenoate hydratase
MAPSRIASAAEPAEVAGRLVRARLERTALADFPAEIPDSLDAAYAIQDAAIAEWPDTLHGWKVGRILEPWLSRFGVDRLVGPIFTRGVQQARFGPQVAAAALPASDPLQFPIFAGGFAAVEAEFVVQLASDAPQDKIRWTSQEAGALVAEMFAGIEPAGSPLASINDLGPAVIVSDFGNNAGLILGPAIPAWSDVGLDRLTTETFIDGQSVGRGTAASVPGGPFAALAFALECCAKRGLPLRAGQFVSTGATTGVHQIRDGQRARVVFGGVCEIHCLARAGAC